MGHLSGSINLPQGWCRAVQESGLVTAGSRTWGGLQGSGSKLQSLMYRTWEVSQVRSESLSDPMSRHSHRSPTQQGDRRPPGWRVRYAFHPYRSVPPRQPCSSQVLLGPHVVPSGGQVPSPLLTSLHSSLHACFVPFPDKQAGGPLFLLLPVRTALEKCQILKADLQIVKISKNNFLCFHT